MSGAGSVCSLCGGEFAEDEVIDVAGHVTCAECKPQLISRLQQGTGPVDSTVAREKKTLVMGYDSELPPRCVKCNEPSARFLKRKLSWHPPGLYLLIFLGILIYAIVAMIVRKTATVEIGLCDRHLRRRRIAIGVAWLMLFVLIGGFAIGMGTDQGAFIGIGFVVALIGWIICGIISSGVSAARIDKEYIWLRGVCRDYLDELPEF